MGSSRDRYAGEAARFSQKRGWMLRPGGIRTCASCWHVGGQRAQHHSRRPTKADQVRPPASSRVGSAPLPAGAVRSASLAEVSGIDEFYRDVATIALTVGEKHGFVLGGGVAWLVNGLVQRPTEDIDLFTDTAGAVEAAAGQVTAALTEAGYQVFREVADELLDRKSTRLNS